MDGCDSFAGDDDNDVDDDDDDDGDDDGDDCRRWVNSVEALMYATRDKMIWLSSSSFKAW